MVKCLLRILTAAVLAMVAWACADDRQKDRIPGMDIVSRLSGTMAEGRYSDALSIADTLLFMPEDSVSAEARKIARGYKALAYIISNKLDSAENYVYELTEMLKTDTGSYYNTVIGYTALGIYAIKKELDYSKAISGFHKAMEVSARYRDTVNLAVSLCNLAAVYMIRKDTAGLRYAEEAWRLSRQKGQPYMMASSATSLSNMLLLAGQYHDALRYVDTAEAYIVGDGDMRRKCELGLIRAQAFSAQGRLREAGDIYSSLQRTLNEAGADMIVKYGVAYGRFLLAQGDYLTAVTVLEQALQSTGISHEDMSTVYLLLSEAFTMTGDDGQSLRYYKMYHAYCDSLAVQEKEIQFGNMIRSYEQVKYEKEIADKELAVEKANKKVAVSIIVVLAVGVTAVVFWVMYRKTNALYRRIVEQYRQYEAKESRLKEQHRSGSGAEGLEESKERALFDRIEQLMSGEKTYRQKDVSLNMLAEKLSSNRAYVSKVINHFAGQTFSAYINSKRIAEAVTVLSDPEDDTPLKMLADNLGYSTLSTFYRAFCKETGCPPSKYRQVIRQIDK